jgi:uncharacterized membrane protein YeaQ/YmgE (transglycosylase-associated protein family)
MHVIGFLIFGLVVGLLARAIYPGPQPMGWVATALLGMIGSLVGGLLGHTLFGTNHANTELGFSPGGLISSIIGAMIVLWVYLGITRKARTV